VSFAGLSFPVNIRISFYISPFYYRIGVGNMEDSTQINKPCVFCENTIKYDRKNYTIVGQNELTGSSIGSKWICKDCAEKLFHAMENNINSMIPTSVDKYMNKKVKR